MGVLFWSGRPLHSHSRRETTTGASDQGKCKYLTNRCHWWPGKAEEEEKHKLGREPHPVTSMLVG